MKILPKTTKINPAYLMEEKYENAQEYVAVYV